MSLISIKPQTNILVGEMPTQNKKKSDKFVLAKNEKKKECEIESIKK
jgi:hypothetical protein